MVRGIEVDGDARDGGQDHHLFDAQDACHVGRGQVLVDDRRDAVAHPVGLAVYGNSTTAAGDDHRAVLGQRPDQRDIDDVLGFRRGNHVAPAAPRVLLHLPAQFDCQGLGLLCVVEIADGLGRIAKCRIVEIDLDLGQQADHVARVALFAQRILQGLHEKIGDAALAVGDADIQWHGGHAPPGDGLA